jgi:hypothetical protein
MAKRSGSPSSPLDLLTASERKLFDTSRGRALAAATRAELTKLVGQARSLRDKWRDQFRAQRRTSQRAAAARGTGGNDRSLEKSTLFGEVLARLEARLAELGEAATRVVGGGERVTKAARTKAHRSTRAATRTALAGLTTAAGGRAKTSRQAAVKAGGPAGRRAATGKAAATSAAADTAKPARAGAADAAAEGTGRKAAKTAASKKRRTGRPVTVAVEKATGKTKKRVIVADPKAQQRAGAKLKAARVHLAGLDTRLRGHTMAQGRRQQGRRDSRAR